MVYSYEGEEKRTPDSTEEAWIRAKCRRG